MNRPGTEPSPIVYAVRAVDAAGNLSPFSTYAVGYPADTTPPSTPANLHLQSAGSYFTATWSASSDNVTVAGYEVTVNGVVSRTSATQVKFPFTIPGVYTVQVRAFDGSGDYSGTATIAIAVDPPPPPPPGN